MSPRQITREFYNQLSRSVLGFGIYYIKNGKRETINVDILSDNINQDAYAVVSALRYCIK
jgi:hypothetical protein